MLDVIIIYGNHSYQCEVVALKFGYWNLTINNSSWFDQLP